MTDFGRRVGDMSKSTYDTDLSGVVDEAESITPGAVVDATKIKGVIINDAAKADQKVLAYDSGSDRIVYISQAPSGATIEKVMSDVITIEDGNTSGTKTITEVDLSKAAIFHLSGGSSAVNLDDNFCRIEITNSTTVTAFRSGAINVVFVSFWVIEWATGINNIQSGVIDLIGVYLNTATVTEANRSKCILTKSGELYDGNDVEDCLASLDFTSPTIITAQRLGNSGNVSVGYQVIEFSE